MQCMMIFRSLQKVHKHDTHSTSGGSKKNQNNGLEIKQNRNPAQANGLGGTPG